MTMFGSKILVATASTAAIALGARTANADHYVSSCGTRYVSYAPTYYTPTYYAPTYYTPTYYAPAPVVYAAPAYRYYQAPAYVTPVYNSIPRYYAPVAYSRSYYAPPRYGFGLSYGRMGHYRHHHHGGSGFSIRVGGR